MKYTITPTDLGDIKEIFKNHYDSIIERLQKNEQLPARIFIEEGLIFEEDKRRLSLYEGQIFTQFKISKELLQKLTDSFIIRAEPHHAGGFVYELSHDTLVAPILVAKKIRKEIEAKIRLEKEREEELRVLKEKALKEQAERELEYKRQKRIITIIGSAALVALIFAVFGLIMWQIADKRTKEAKKYSMQLEKQKDTLQNQKQKLEKMYEELKNKSFAEAKAKYNQFILEAEKLEGESDFSGAIEKYEEALEKIKGFQYKDSTTAINGIKKCIVNKQANDEFKILMQKADAIVLSNDECEFKEALVLYNNALAKIPDGAIAKEKSDRLQNVINDRFKKYYDNAMGALALDNQEGKYYAIELLNKASKLKPQNNAAQQKLNELK